jgi:hypothetical protein
MRYFPNISFRGAAEGQSRSSVLYSLQWGLGILFPGTGILLWRKAPEWMIDMAGVFLAINFVAFIFAYFWFMAKNPDALRSEQRKQTKSHSV